MRQLKFYPDPILFRKSKPVTGDISCLVADMRRIMVCHGGLGLAAPQVGELLRVILVRNKVLVNPEIVFTEDLVLVKEGCISLPNRVAEMLRFRRVSVEYTDSDQTYVQEDFTDLAAQIVQHEIDHLNGIFLGNTHA